MGDAQLIWDRDLWQKVAPQNDFGGAFAIQKSLIN